MPAFFVPFVEAKNYEEAYQELAAAVGAAPRPPENRIYSMTWRHDGVVWTATVGETLKGVATVITGRGRDRREREVPRSSGDTVLAIFPGQPGLIAHDGKSGYWNFPILTGEALNIVRFASTQC
jgi:hypothetical protein